MLFGWIEDEHYIDLLDEKGRVFRRFKDMKSYNDWVARFSPSDLTGLTRVVTNVKWYDSNKQLAKLITPVVFVVFLILRAQ